MNRSKKKKVKRQTRKTIFGIKLPPIEPVAESNVNTLLDVDPKYYSLVDGRPIRTNKSIKVYKDNVKNIAFKRIVHGFLVDEIQRINREIKSERYIYETAYKHFEEYQTSFDNFLAHDNNKTIAIMQKSDALSKELMNQNEDLKQANYELASLKSKLQYIEETLMILLSFQNFLNKASPILWQNSHNIKLDLKCSEIFTVDSDIFKEIDKDVIQKRLNELPHPQLYFDSPEQLLVIFGLLEKQNLNYLLLTEEYNSEKNRFMKTVVVLKVLMRQELEYIQDTIKDMEEIIAWNENREEEIKSHFLKILGDNMRYLISSGTVLQIFTYVEFAYEQLITSNETRLSSKEMALALESEYENLMLDLSAYDLNMIKQIEKETYEDGLQEIKQAKVAEKLLKDVDKLSKRLKSSFEPTRRKINY